MIKKSMLLSLVVMPTLFAADCLPKHANAASSVIAPAITGTMSLPASNCRSRVASVVLPLNCWSANVVEAFGWRLLSHQMKVTANGQRP